MSLNLFDILLQKIELICCFKTFELLLKGLLNSQLKLYYDVSNPVVKDAIKRNVAYLSVMLQFLDDNFFIPDLVNNMVKEEIKNIDNGKIHPSAIFYYDEDYSQYKPRGHYANNETFERYFKAMMYAGRMTFILKDPEGNNYVNQTRMALLLISSFNDTIGDKQIWDYWDRLYEPIKFFVGDSDDLTPKEYYSVWTEIGRPKGDQLADDNAILEFIERAENLRNPRINSAIVDFMRTSNDILKGLRLLGQRFIPESYIFQQLISPDVPGRLIPSGLDVFAVLGSERAKSLALNYFDYLNYPEKLTTLQEEFANISLGTWVQNLYMGWLYSLKPLFEPKNEEYPFFMQSDAWIDKSLMTAMGSWAELRHDTILYTKQSASPRGSGCVSGYIEPYPEVYGRLASLVRLMREGLSMRGLLIEPYESKLLELENIFEKLTVLSIKELENKSFTNSERYFVSHVGDRLAKLVRNSYGEEIDKYERDGRTALIADVHTEPRTQQILEVGVGDPYIIYVIVQNPGGNLYVAVGGTFSYYEFTMPNLHRLTDEEWYEMIDNNTPEIPEWQTITLPIINNQMTMYSKNQRMLQTCEHYYTKNEDKPITSYPPA